MKISTRGRYGLRIALELALHYGKGPLPVKEIARKQELSEGYIEHIILALQKGGIVKTTRGKEGGCFLTREPSSITLYELMKILEGPLFLVDCLETPTRCSRTKICAAREIWMGLKSSIVRFFKSITLEDMIKIHLEKTTGNVPYMYYI